MNRLNHRLALARMLAAAGLLSIAQLFPTPALAEDRPKWEPAEGERIVLVGGTLIERDQAYGYLETLLTRRFPQKSFVLRNLGWSGDTVEGIARARFGPPADGFKHLQEHVVALKPTVLVLSYGANESFEGPAGLPRFKADTAKLLAMLKAAAPGAKIHWMLPNQFEDLGRPLPSPEAANANYALYREAIKAIAKERNEPVLDLAEVLPAGSKAAPLTDNGMHLSAYGYWQMGGAIERALGLAPATWKVELSDAKVESASGTAVSSLVATDSGIKFQATDEFLPAPAAPDVRPKAAETTLPGAGRILKVSGLKPGKYVLKVDGETVASGDAEAWSKGVGLTKGPEFDQVESLRGKVWSKNELYFHRWRPENETYLTGFRKHEQGQNAREIPLFDPLVAKRESEIAQLRVPKPHTYELTREGEAK